MDNNLLQWVFTVFTAILGFILSLPLFGGETLPKLFNFVYMVICPPYALLWALVTVATNHHGQSMCKQDENLIDYDKYCKVMEMRNISHYCCPSKHRLIYNRG